MRGGQVGGFQAELLSSGRGGQRALDRNVTEGLEEVGVKGTPRLGRPATESTSLPGGGADLPVDERGDTRSSRGVCPGGTGDIWCEALCTRNVQTSLSTR